VRVSTVGGRRDLKRAENCGVGCCVKAFGSSAESAYVGNSLATALTVSQPLLKRREPVISPMSGVAAGGQSLLDR